MPLWDKVRQELDRAGRVAQQALDDGRLRLEIVRCRQLADRAAQALGYAVHRAAVDGTTAEPGTVGRLSAAIAAHEAELQRLEARVAQRAPRAGSGQPPPAAASPEDDGPRVAQQPGQGC